jgi:predicted GNAT family N-acyltransferase
VLFELLGSAHDRNRFDCGVAPLNDFLRERARQEMSRDASITYVLVPADDRMRVIGYYSLASSSVPLQELPEAVRKKLPRYPALPATLLARLARDVAFGGQRIGEKLLTDALARCARTSRVVASTAVFVDAKDANAASFYARYGFRPLEDDALRLFMPMHEIRKAFNVE